MLLVDSVVRFKGAAAFGQAIGRVRSTEEMIFDSLMAR